MGKKKKIHPPSGKISTLGCIEKKKFTPKGAEKKISPPNPLRRKKIHPPNQTSYPPGYLMVRPLRLLCYQSVGMQRVGCGVWENSTAQSCQNWLKSRRMTTLRLVRNCALLDKVWGMRFNSNHQRSMGRAYVKLSFNFENILQLATLEN